MGSAYYTHLIKKVLDASYGKTWEEAVREWKIVDCEEDEKSKSKCVCGKENLKYLYTIQNDQTGKILYPIGSSCIKKFCRDDLDEEIKIQEGMFKLCHAIEDGERIELSARYFSKNLLYYFYLEGVFRPNQYNHYAGENDYQFMLDMFNKKNKENISEAQKRKINAIIVSSIKPFLQQTLHYKRR